MIEHGLRPVKSRNWSLKNRVQTRHRCRHRRCDAPSARDFPSRGLERLTITNVMVARRAGSKLEPSWIDWPVNSPSNEPTVVEPPGQVHRRGLRVRLVVLRLWGAQTSLWRCDLARCWIGGRTTVVRCLGWRLDVRAQPTFITV